VPHVLPTTGLIAQKKQFWGSAPKSAWNVLFAVIAFGVLGLRLYHCTRMPAHTGDIARHLLYGLAVNRWGLAAAAHSLVEFNPAFASISWSHLPFNYPVLTLLFFSAVAAILPTLFFARLCLTLLEGLSAIFIYGTTGERWLALLYWASPLSIWWTSREGQFEALQNVLVFLALYLLKRRPAIAFLVLGLAIQVKLSAFLLLPVFVLALPTRATRQTLACLGGFAASLLPTGIACLYYPALAQIQYSAPLLYNPYYWNILDRPMFSWNPGWMIWFNQIGSYGILTLVLVWFLRSKNRVAYLAPIAFLVACKWHKNVQFWYMQLFPSFTLPIPEPRLRLVLFLVVPLLDIYSLAMVWCGPLYLGVGGYYGQLTPFTRF